VVDAGELHCAAPFDVGSWPISVPGLGGWSLPLAHAAFAFFERRCPAAAGHARLYR
jgi:hypothetical protein